MTLEEIESAFASPDAEQRRVAVCALEVAGPEAGHLLVQGLGDPDWRVRQEAIRVGVTRPSRELIDALVGAIAQGDNVGLRNAALELLGELGGQALEPLVAALPRVDEGVRKFVIEALARVGDARATGLLVRLLDDGDPMLVTAAIEALAALGGEDACRALVARLRVEDGLQRMAALDALNRLEVRLDYEVVASLSRDRLSRRLAIVALGRCEDSRAAALLLDSLGDVSPRVRQVAAEGLSRLRRAPDCIEAVAAVCLGASARERDALEALARHGDADSRRVAVELLALARDPRTFDLLLEFSPREVLDVAGFEALTRWPEQAATELLDRMHQAQASDPTLLEVVSDLLAKLRDGPERSDRLPELVESLRRSLRVGMHSSDPELAATAARCLAVWPEAADAARFVSLAARSQPPLAALCADALERLAAVEASAVSEALRGVNLDSSGGAQLTTLVANLGGEAALERLHTALLARDPETRCAAIQAVARVGGTRGAELIALSLNDESHEVQAVAAAALGAVRDAGGRAVGVDSLLLALDSEVVDVRAAAARGLGAAGDPAAVAPLRRRVRGEAPAVTIAALEALRQLEPGALDELFFEMLSHDDREVVKQALRGLAESRDERAIARLATALDHVDWAVRRLAATLLAERGGATAQRALAARAPLEQDELVRAVIEEALVTLADRGTP